MQSTIISLYLVHPFVYDKDEISSVFPILSRYYFFHGECNWLTTFGKISGLCESNRYQRVHALCNELTAETPRKSLKIDQKTDQSDVTIPLATPPPIFTESQINFRSQFLKLFTITPETLLEFTLHIILFNPNLFKTSSIFSSLFQPSQLSKPIPFQSKSYNYTQFLQLFQNLSPVPPLLSATLAGQLESIYALLSLPTLDINSRIQSHTKSLSTIIDERLLNAYSLPEISTQKIPGVNPATLPLVPNKILACPPFSSESVHSYPHTRLSHLSSNHLFQSYIHPLILTSTSINDVLTSTPTNSTYNSIQPLLKPFLSAISTSSTTTSKTTITNTDNTSSSIVTAETISTVLSPSSQTPATQKITSTTYILASSPHVTSKSSPLLQSPELLQLYYFVMNQFAPILYTAASMINGSSNNIVTKRLALIQRDEVLYATEDSDTYPMAPPSNISPWFFPPSSPTPVDHRSRARSVNSSSKTPLIRYVYVAPSGAWKRIEDEDVKEYMTNEETKNRTYLLASSKQPRTLFTDALDTVIFFLKSGAEILLPLAAIIINDNAPSTTFQQQADHIGYFSFPSNRYQTITPVPVSIQETLPNNALTNSARLAVRIGLVRYQRWCNHTTNHLLDTFMDCLGFDRIQNRAYHRFNGHHWPYAYIKQTPTQENEFSTLTIQSHSPFQINEIPSTSKNPQPSKLIGTPNSLIRDIKNDPLYLDLLSLVFTTRSTQMKLGIQEIPVPVVYNPNIPAHIQSAVRRFKRYQGLLQNPTGIHNNSSIDDDNVDDDKNQVIDDDDDDLYTANGLTKRTHLPTNSFSPTLSLIPWFYSYHFTSKHFLQLAKRNLPSTNNSNGPKKGTSSHKDNPSFGGHACAVRKEADRRLAEKVRRLELERLEFAPIVITSTLPTEEVNPLLEEKPKTRPVAKLKASKITKADLDDLMGSSSSKKKKEKVKPGKKGGEPIPEPIATPLEEESKEELSPKSPQRLTETPSSTFFEQSNDSSPIVSVPGPNYDQSLILHPAHFPHPVLFNNFYDSDDDLPLLLSLSRYHGSGSNQHLEHIEQQPSSTTALAAAAAAATTTITSSTFVLPDPKIKAAIDNQITCPHLKSNPVVAQMLRESYKLSSTTIDPHTELYNNQIILGSTGHITCESLTPEEAERLDFVTTSQAQSQSQSPPIMMNPLFIPSHTTTADILQPKPRCMTSIDMISNDHFLTQEMSHALEMASTLSTLVLLYCGQNTHRGYTDLQYQVKIGHPLQPFK